jgi:hypothetical protein
MDSTTSPTGRVARVSLIDLRETTLSCKDAAKGKELAGVIDGGLKKGIAELTKAAAEKKEFTAMVDAVKSVKVATKDQTITLTAQAKVDAVDSFIRYFMAWTTAR